MAECRRAGREVEVQQSGSGGAPLRGRKRLSRVIIAAVVALAIYFLVATVPGFWILGWVGVGGLSLLTFVVVFVAIFAYVAYVRVVERRAITELSLSRAPAEVGVGVLLGVGYMAATLGLIWLLGGYEFTWTYAWTGVFVSLLVGLLAAVGEEIVYRGILLRITEEALGTWLALALSAAVFGAGHVFNPDATVVDTVAIAVEAGILLGAVYVLTRRLWVCIGLHAAWNFTQGGIFGVPVSGTGASMGLLSAEPVGPVLLSGGDFGPEASVVAVVLGLALGIYFLGRAVKQGRIVQPFWRRENTARKGEQPRRNVLDA